MAEFQDPITDTTYDPLGDPAGTALKSVYVIAGIAMTLLLFNIASGSVLPRVQSVLGLGGDSGGFDVSVSGGGL